MKRVILKTQEDEEEESKEEEKINSTSVTIKSKGNKSRQTKQGGVKLKADIGPLKKRCITTAYLKNGNHKDDLIFKKHSGKYKYKYLVSYIEKSKFYSLLRKII